MKQRGRVQVGKVADLTLFDAVPLLDQDEGAVADWPGKH